MLDSQDPDPLQRIKTNHLDRKVTGEDAQRWRLAELLAHLACNALAKEARKKRIHFVIRVHNRNNCSCESYSPYDHHVLDAEPGCGLCGHVHRERNHDCYPVCSLTESENERAFLNESGSYRRRRR